MKERFNLGRMFLDDVVHGPNWPSCSCSYVLISSGTRIECCFKGLKESNNRRIVLHTTILRMPTPLNGALATPSYGTRTLWLFHVDTKPFTFHISFPFLELGHTLFQGFHDEHQVYSIEKFPWHNNGEFVRQCFQHQDKEQWAKDSPDALPTPMPNSHYWTLTRTRPQALWFMPCMIRTAHSSTHRLLKAHHMTFLGTWLKAFSRSAKAK